MGNRTIRDLKPGDSAGYTALKFADLGTVRVTVIGLALLLVMVAVYLAYRPGLSGPFLLDDRWNLERLEVPVLSWDDLLPVVQASPQFGGLSRSVGNLSLALTANTSGLDASVFKYQNVLIHIANGLLVFWFVALLIRFSARPTNRLRMYLLALVIASLWLLHPLHVSTVLYVVQRLVLVSAFFSLLTLCFYLEGRMLINSRPVLGTALIVVALCVWWPLALASKENAVLVAPMLFLLEGFFQQPEVATRVHRFMRVAAFSLVALISLAITISVLSGSFDGYFAAYDGRDFGAVERLLTQVHAVWLYISLILFPVPSDMTLFHDGFMVQRVVDLRTGFGIIGLSVLILFAFLVRKRHPVIGFGILWFFCWHLLESTVLPLELVFEHRNYIASLGLLLALVFIILSVSQRVQERHRTAFLSLLLIVAVSLLGLNTASRAYQWGDWSLLVLTDYAHHPNSPRLVEAMFARSVAAADADGALHFAREQQRLKPDDLYGVLQEMYLYCQSARMPTGLVDRAFAVAAKGRVTPASVRGLRRINEESTAGRCPTLSRETLLSLAQALVENPRSLSVDSPVAALTTLALIASQNGNGYVAATAMGRALTVAKAHSPGVYNDALHAAGVVVQQFSGNRFGMRPFFINSPSQQRH